MAALFSSVDICGDDRFEFAAKQMGVLHWDFGGRIVGLREYRRDEFLLQWVAGAIRMDSYRACGAAGSADCGSGLVLKFAVDHRLCVGVSTTKTETSG